MYFQTFRRTVFIQNRKISTNIYKNLFKNHESAKLASQNEQNKKNRATLHYIIATGVLGVGLSYAAVPLYRMFCQVYQDFHFVITIVPRFLFYRFFPYITVPISGL